MNYQIAKELYDKAEEEFSNAQEELARPSADVVSYSVCLAARRALHHYLNSLYTLYAYENDETREDPLTVTELIKKCQKYDDRIENLDFSCVRCKDRDVLSEGEIYFCDDINQIMACNNMAKQVRQLILEKVENNESQSQYFSSTQK